MKKTFTFLLITLVGYSYAQTVPKITPLKGDNDRSTRLTKRLLANKQKLDSLTHSLEKRRDSKLKQSSDVGNKQTQTKMSAKTLSAATASTMTAASDTCSCNFYQNGSLVIGDVSKVFNSNILIGGDNGNYMSDNFKTNTIVGTSAGENITNRDNTVLGYFAGASFAGQQNVAVGSLAGISNTGYGNTFLGYASSGFSTGSWNVTIGNSAGANLGAGSNNIIIGTMAGVDNPDASDQLSIGNLIYGTSLDGGFSGGVSTGRIGIGNSTPQAKLDVFGDLLLGGNNANLDPLYKNLDFLNGSSRMLIGYNLTGSQNEVDFIGNKGSDNTDVRGGFAFYQHDNNGQNRELLRMESNGDVRVGWFDTSTDRNIVFNVNGTVHTRKVYVDLNYWPDYVFKKGYKLRPLLQVQKYIEQNHHLPEMPSAEQVESNGVDLGEVVKIQTKKIEELTLYLIKQEARVRKLENQLKRKSHK